MNAATGQAMGAERTYTIEGALTKVIEFTEEQFDNIAVLLPENYWHRRCGGARKGC